MGSLKSPCTTCYRPRSSIEIIALNCLELKQQVTKQNAFKLDVCSKINACYIFVCIFFQICENSDLRIRFQNAVFTGLATDDQDERKGREHYASAQSSLTEARQEYRT